MTEWLRRKAYLQRKDIPQLQDSISRLQNIANEIVQSSPLDSVQQSRRGVVPWSQEIGALNPKRESVARITADEVMTVFDHLYGNYTRLSRGGVFCKLLEAVPIREKDTLRYAGVPSHYRQALTKDGVIEPMSGCIAIETGA
jgi:hypothetical protein